MVKGDYSMSVDSIKKEMKIKVVGNFTPQQAEQFINDYNKHIASINAALYVLRLDCTDINVVTPELIPALEACYQLYKISGFKEIICEVRNAAVIKMQLYRISRKVGLEVKVIEVA